MLFRVRVPDVSASAVSYFSGRSVRQTPGGWSNLQGFAAPVVLHGRTRTPGLWSSFGTRPSRSNSKWAHQGWSEARRPAVGGAGLRAKTLNRPRTSPLVCQFAGVKTCSEALSLAFPLRWARQGVWRWRVRRWRHPRSRGPVRAAAARGSPRPVRGGSRAAARGAHRSHPVGRRDAEARR